MSVEGADDVALFAGVEKWVGNKWVSFEGSYGYGRDRITTGWQRVSLRELDVEQSTPYEPVHTFAHSQPLSPGEVVPVELALGPSATAFHHGDRIRLVIAGRKLAPRNPLYGSFPALYAPSPPARCTLHWGADRPARLRVPVTSSGDNAPA